MRKVIVNEFMSLDGVVQAPGGADEDMSGGFGHGGWHPRYFDDLSQQRVLESIVEAGSFLLGRCHLPDLRGVLAERARGGAGNCRASEHEAEVRGVYDAHRAARFGSTELVQFLIEHDLVDEFRLMIDPVMLGGASASSAKTVRSGRCDSSAAR